MADCSRILSIFLSASVQSADEKIACVFVSGGGGCAVCMPVFVCLCEGREGGGLCLISGVFIG